VQLNVKILSVDREASLRAQERYAVLFGTPSLGALPFAGAGLFAALSYMVSQRMREFGVRVAIGANSQLSAGRTRRRRSLQ
jgi:ABC-type antimicrobial peptide transport system permease subunit